MEAVGTDLGAFGGLGIPSVSHLLSGDVKSEWGGGVRMDFGGCRARFGGYRVRFGIVSWPRCSPPCVPMSPGEGGESYLEDAGTDFGCWCPPAHPSCSPWRCGIRFWDPRPLWDHVWGPLGVWNLAVGSRTTFRAFLGCDSDPPPRLTLVRWWVPWQRSPWGSRPRR